MYAITTKMYLEGEEQPTVTSVGAVSESVDVLEKALIQLCKAHGAPRPSWTDFGWRYSYDGFVFLSTIDEVVVLTEKDAKNWR